MTIEADDVEAIARRIAQLVGQSSRLLVAQSVAAALDVERERVHAHARELGVVRLGPRLTVQLPATAWRSDPTTCAAAAWHPSTSARTSCWSRTGGLPIAHMTPHTVRRRFVSIVAAANVPPRRVMYLLGHTDARPTLSVYQQIRHGGRLDRRPGGRAGCSLLEACDVMAGRVS